MSNDPRNIEELYSAFEAADNMLLKKYIPTLSKAHCIQIPEEIQKMTPGDNVSLYRIASIVYDKEENVQEKLTSVYSTALSLKDASLVILLHGTKERIDLFMGIADKDLKADDKNGVRALRFDDMGNAFEGAMLGIFPGTRVVKVNNAKMEDHSADDIDSYCKNEILSDCLDEARFIAAVSSIPAPRGNSSSKKNSEFVQGLEKLIDTMRHKSYSMFIISDVTENNKIEELCAQYEDIYSQIAPFKQSTQTLSTTEGSTDTESVIKGVTDTTNKILAKSSTHGTSFAKTKSHSVGGHVGGKHIGFNYNYTNSSTKSENEATTTTESEGTAKSLTEQNSVAKSLSETSGESVQISYENRAVKTLLDRIDEQIKRLRSCEDFGLFNTCAYFAAEDYDTVASAASTFKSITRGENSSVEASAVNIWTDEEDVENIKKYLQYFYHPEFLLYFNEDRSYPVTPALLISGKEMAYQMALPKKSVVGLPVIECAEFGRDVISYDDVNVQDDEFDLGEIFHMNQKEDTKVFLNKNALTSHTFITGSTGSGKSTTVYKILSEAKRQNVKFLVVEPAKGEYKNDICGLGVSVYGTNPQLSHLLRINPFSFPGNKIHIYEHMDRLAEIFNVCWPMYAAMPAVLKAAIENAYRSAGWNLVKSKNPYGDVFPSFIDVAEEVEKYINRSEYSDENKSNYKGSLLTRLESLTNGINGMIFTSDELEEKELFDENVIIDLSRVGSPETKSLIMGILVLKLQEYRMSAKSGANNNLKHITVLEEAHNLLKRTSTEQVAEGANILGKSVEMLANSIAEMRTYGEGFIIADQAPGLLDLSVIRNTNTKIVMRLPDYTDRELVGRAANLNDDQIAELAKLPRGVAAVYQSGWVNPVLCNIEKPEIKSGKVNNIHPITYSPNNFDSSIVLKILDPKYREELCKLDEVEWFKEKIKKSSISTDIKIGLLKYIAEDKDLKSIIKLSSVLYDYFENTKESLEKTLSDTNAYDLRNHIMLTLKPSLKNYDDDLVNMAVALIIKEYRDRYSIDYPVWQEFVIKLSKGEIK